MVERIVSRRRSPSYPSTPLDQAIDMVRKLHQIERSNPVDREVAAKALGYSGLSGRSATILSNLIQYGLLEKAGKNEVRVTARAVEILHPDSEASKAEALRDAAEEPELFQRVRERFPDGMPSTNALESFFVKIGFTDAAIPAAIRAFQETFVFLENAIEYESYSQDDTQGVESQSNQQFERFLPMPATSLSSAPVDKHQRFAGGGAIDPVGSGGADVRFAQKKIWLSGVITNPAEADELIATINALKSMLKAPESKADDPVVDTDTDDLV